MIKLKKPFLLFSFSVIFASTVMAQSYQPFQQHERLRYNGYQFTIFPGTEAWKDLDVNANKHALLQIPEDTLRAISTRRLIETCLYYPMIMNVFSFDNKVQGFEFIRKNFNGLGELFQRQDAGMHLLSYYQHRAPAFITQFEESVDRGRYSFDFVLLELMIAQAEITEQLNISQIQEIISSILGKIEQQSTLSQYYSRVFIPISAITVGRMLLQANAFSEATIQNSTERFIKNGIGGYTEDISQIFNQAQIFANKNK
ncbi:MAG: hypothetical protein FWF09_01080 [Bacteroidales bacterium]|nr:hypothetical protein [Bacteroidales bacterium]